MVGGRVWGDLDLRASGAPCGSASLSALPGALRGRSLLPAACELWDFLNKCWPVCKDNSGNLDEKRGKKSPQSGLVGYITHMWR